MRNLYTILLISILIFNSKKSFTQIQNNDSIYTFKKGDYNGIGKWYMGREIAFVMGYQAIGWLERSEREQEENVTKLIENMKINSNDVVADIGAGSGYHSFKISSKSDKGLVYAVDIQPEMLLAIENRKELSGVINIKTILGSEKSVNLPTHTLDKVLMVDVYHEFNFPLEMILSIKKALKPNGKLFLVEYRSEDPNVPIKSIHKMSEEQAIKEMNMAGFKFIKNINNLPWQHCMVFVKNETL
jgi:SAM-dependent methyltransferase